MERKYREPRGFRCAVMFWIAERRLSDDRRDDFSADVSVEHRRS